MGERHQLFVIAKRGARYKCLAVMHHQWLYGTTALQRLSRLLLIFSHPSNRIALEQELVFSAIEAPETEGKTGEGILQVLLHPFPFITTCLYLGTVSDPEVGVLNSRVCIETPRLGYDEGDNNTGITVIDITDLDRLRYCYVWLSYEHNDRPESAREYLGRFYQIDDPPGGMSGTNKAALESLSKFELIPSESLQDCWPDGGFSPGEEAELAVYRGELPRKMPPPESLLEMAMNKFLDELLPGGDDANVSLVHHALQSPSMKDALSEYCRRNAGRLAESPSPAALKVLTAFLSGSRCVDLSPFHQMAPDVMRSLLKSLKDVRVLNLSGTLAASKNELGSTLAAIGHDLDELYILARPDREIEDPAAVVRAVGSQPFKYRKLVLASMLSQPFLEKYWWPRSRAKPQSTSLPVDCSSDLHGLSKSFPVIQIFLKGFPRVFNPPVCESYFLGDGLFSPVRVVTGIFNVIRGRLLKSWLDNNGSILAHAFASASSSLNSGSLEINALPAQTFHTGVCSEYESMNQGFHCRVRDLTPDTWTVILVQESCPDSPEEMQGSRKVWFKVALLRPNKIIPAEQGQNILLEDVEVVDLETFLAKTSPADVADLEQAIEEIRRFADKNRPQSASDERICRTDAAEAVGAAEEVIRPIDAAGAISIVEEVIETAHRVSGTP